MALQSVDADAGFDRRGLGLTSQGIITAVILIICGALVLYPLFFLFAESLNIGDPQVFPPERIGFGNYVDMLFDWRIIGNTLKVALFSTGIAVTIGFILAWILTRTEIPGRAVLERLMEVPFYVTPLVGALSWSILAAPQSGFLNQAWAYFGGSNRLIDVYTPMGVAWVMALFEGSVAFVMISAAMKSMDPALEEGARVMGASKLRTMITVTLPLVAPGVLGAAIFVFAEMLGSFAAALVLGIPGHFYVITTAIWELTLSYPPDYGRASALGISLFVIMFATLALYRWLVRKDAYSTISGKAFRPRRMQMGRWTWVLAGFCWLYVVVAVVMPLGALLITSFERFATVLLHQAQFTAQNYITAFSLASVRDAIVNSLILGFGTATVGVFVMVLLVWIIYRSRMPGAGVIEYVVMFPQAVPRMVFGLAILWAWLNMPVSLYGTLWLLGIGYFTVLLPLGVRTLAGVVLQVDKSLEECARVCGASWTHQLRTITLPLLKPGILAAWLLLFIASVRELGVSIYLMGPNSKVIAPAIVSSWSSAGTELTAAMAVIQTLTIFIAVMLMFWVTARLSKQGNES
ncbi:Molybdenum transport system permease protein ModB [Ensifer psoraleae]|uniref:ABC transporter permease n=1 Tax=Sinorhizobium psoraleae TaxID=520838 RepID=UPI001569E664|nr:iron ABC transporter permease [Sinorhizobium psoraleae]NRP72186.1 Molybdenum transport system permease protein ModB [Sinorhizobium psoraleae]